jgi:hypothetical protein
VPASRRLALHKPIGIPSRAHPTNGIPKIRLMGATTRKSQMLGRKSESTRLGQNATHIMMVAHTESSPYANPRKSPTILNNRLNTAKIKQD